MRIVHVAPEDINNIPFDDNCLSCSNFKAQPSQPGLITWVGMVADHMEREHDIELRTPKRD